MIEIGNYQVCILGAGLSGCLTAMKLSKFGVKVCLLTKDSNKNFFDYETVSGSFLKLLEKFDIHFNLTYNLDIVQRNTDFTSAWGTSNVQAFNDINHFQINKEALVQYLQCKVLKNNIPLYSVNHLPITSYEQNKWLIQVGSKNLLTCDLIIDSTGRKSIFARKQGKRKIFVDNHFAISNSTNNSLIKQNTFILESAKNGWWYSITAEKKVQSVFITNAELIKKVAVKKVFQKNYFQTYFIKQNQKKLSNQMEFQVKDARAGILSQSFGNGWLAIGDSTFTLDPLSGRGSETVINSILISMDYILRYLSSKDKLQLKVIDKEFNSIFLHHLKERHKYYGLEQRWKQSPFWCYY